MAPSSTRTDPAMPTCAMIRHSTPDPHVVRDLHEVVDLRAGADHRVVDAPAVDRRVRADLDVVLDDAAADVRNLQMLAVALHVAEAVGPDPRAGVNRHAVADAPTRCRPSPTDTDGCALADPNAGADRRVCAPMTTESPSRTPSPITAYGPIDTSCPNVAPTPMTAVAWTPRAARRRRGESAAAARAAPPAACRRRSARATCPASPRAPAYTSTTPACDAVNIDAYFAVPRKLRSRDDARSSGATPLDDGRRRRRSASRRRPPQ